MNLFEEDLDRVNKAKSLIDSLIEELSASKKEKLLDAIDTLCHARALVAEWNT
jgi:uncharacterized protein YjgD (DUF1641 family)